VLRGESQTDEIDAPAASDGLDIGGFGHFVQSVTECIGSQSIQAIALSPVAITLKRSATSIRVLMDGSTLSSMSDGTLLIVRASIVLTI
jgi:hypothetical protein